jgi:hypothetical protein
LAIWSGFSTRRASDSAKLTSWLLTPASQSLHQVDVLSEALFDELSDILFRGVFFTVQKALPHLGD